RCRIDDKQIWLTVGAEWAAGRRSHERDLTSIGRDAWTVDRAVDAGNLRDRPASRGHAIEIGVAWLVVRLEHARGNEVDLRTVRRPLDLTLVVLAVGDLLRLRLIAAVRRGHREDVRVAAGIDVGRVAVGSIHRPRDHLDVALRLLLFPILLVLRITSDGGGKREGLS